MSVFLLIGSCGGGTWDSIKRGATGQKQKSTDEFLVEKKDPLVLPPNYESLPDPSEANSNEEAESFEKKLGTISTEEDSSTTSSEQSILERIRRE